MLNADFVSIIGSQVVLHYFFENLIISRQFRNDYGRIFLTLDMRTPILEIPLEKMLSWPKGPKGSIVCWY